MNCCWFNKGWIYCEKGEYCKMKKDKIIIISLIAAIMLGLLFLASGPLKEMLGWESIKQSSKNKDSQLKDVLSYIESIEFSEVDEKSTFFSTNGQNFDLNHTVISGESIYVKEITYKEKKKSAGIESLLIKQYDLHTQKLVTEFDIVEELAQEVEDGYEIPDFFVVEKRAKDQQDVLTSMIFSEDEMLWVILDPETGSVETQDGYDFDLFEDRDYEEENGYYIYFDEEFKEAQGFDDEMQIYADISGNLFATMTGASITKDSKELLKHFPNLKEYMGNLDANLYFYFQDGFTREDGLALFKPTKNKEFEPFTMSKENAVDNQPHEITSFSEYDQWSKNSYQNFSEFEEDFDSLDELDELDLLDEDKEI